ncbi:hypothetical protein C5167_038446 [Papaver somniferum]|uniref:Uncharacterized protein n=1 Tax=Papaver somniferum TaxID=3469 RepID=A0A4Y7IDM9_PAPSO|nr:hypothetical protein C5167_038446 [Papaver somniferum]
MKTVSFLLIDDVKRLCEIKAQLVGYINQRTKSLLFFADANLRDQPFLGGMELVSTVYGSTTMDSGTPESLALIKN